MRITVALPFVLALFAPLADADDNVRWREIVGIIEAGNLVGSGGGQVAGAPGPWSASGGRARANVETGELRFQVRDGDSVVVDSPIVPLSPTGDADFQGSLAPLPDACREEPDVAFLIRAAGFGVWLANGAVRIP